MPQNTVASGRAWLYVKNVGRQGQVGMGFSQPVGVVALPDGVMYVASRGGEQNPSARITKCTIGNVEGKGGEEFLGEFGRKAPLISPTRGVCSSGSPESLPMSAAMCTLPTSGKTRFACSTLTAT